MSNAKLYADEDIINVLENLYCLSPNDVIVENNKYYNYILICKNKFIYAYVPHDKSDITDIEQYITGETLIDDICTLEDLNIGEIINCGVTLPNCCEIDITIRDYMTYYTKLDIIFPALKKIHLYTDEYCDPTKICAAHK